MEDLNYQLGQAIGNIIELTKLPTLSTDVIQTRTTIQVTDEDDVKTHKELCSKMNDMVGNQNGFLEAHKNWIEFYNPMAKRYLPKTIECFVEKVEVTDMGMFQKGLNDYLWDTDISYYTALDGFFVQGDKYEWFSKIILTRHDE